MLQYGLSDDNVQLLINYGAFLYLIVALPFAAWLERPNGFRQAMLFSTALLTAGCLLRCFARDASTTSQALVHLSFVFNAVAGPLGMGGVCHLSESWVGADSRTVTTAVLIAGE